MKDIQSMGNKTSKQTTPQLETSDVHPPNLRFLTNHIHSHYSPRSIVRTLQTLRTCNLGSSGHGPDTQLKLQAPVTFLDVGYFGSGSYVKPGPADDPLGTDDFRPRCKTYTGR